MTLARPVMEPVSFGLGVIGLVPTFSACVDCFDYFRIGRNLGSDYEKSVLKLDIVRLRFTRWGEGVGIRQGDENAAVAPLKDRLAIPNKDFATVERGLGQILSLFENTAETSNRLKFKSSANETIVGEDIALENATMHMLHDHMRTLALQRQKRSTTLHKMRWALYRKRDFEGLIEDLTELVTALIELVPAKSQEELCNRELAELSTDQNLVILDNVLQDPVGEENSRIDEVFHRRVTDIIGERKGSMTTAAWKRSKVGDDSTIRQGDNIASDYKGQILDRPGSYVVEDTEVGKNVVFHQGHSYGGHK